MSETGDLRRVRPNMYKLEDQSGAVFTVRDIDARAKAACEPMNSPRRVEFDRDDGHPVRIRLAPVTAPANPPVIRRNRPPPPVPAKFHHAYNFVPFDGSEHVGLAGHDHEHEKGVSGEIVIELEVVTPLLIPDVGERPSSVNAKHKVYDMRTGREGIPLLAPTALKGPLRAAFESLTRSRFGVLTKHDQPVAYRSTNSLDIVPVAVTKVSGTLCVERFKGAAWLPMYSTSDPLRLPGRGARVLGTYARATAKTGDQVLVRVENTTRPPRGFPYTRVTCIDNGASAPTRGQKRGIVVVTGPNVKGKHDERVFYGARTVLTSLTGDLERDWNRLIADYKRANAKTLEARAGNEHVYLGHEPGKTALSPHLYQPAWQTFDTTPIYCWAVMASGRVVALQPVQLSRRLYDRVPDDLVPDTARPADAEAAATAAERLFGWVGKTSDGPAGHRGRLRIGQPRCTSAVTPFEEHGGRVLPDGRALPILSTPKLTQGRFYLRARRGNAPLDRVERPSLYDDKKQVARGFKVYPHHADRVNDKSSEKTEAAWRADARTFVEDRSDQNRSITGWVSPGTKFEVRLYLDDVAKEDVGPLAWLLTLGERQRPGHLRLGLGKSLGFGSVRPRIKSSTLSSGAARRKALLILEEPAADVCPRASARQFEDKGDKAAITQFLVSACGYVDGLPVAYPVRIERGERGIYQWFSANESRHGLRKALPPLGEDDDLPGDPIKPH